LPSSTSPSATSPATTPAVTHSVTSSSSLARQPEPATSKPPRQVCRLFLAGRCKMKKGCNWSHESPAQPVSLESRFVHLKFGLTLIIRRQPRHHLRRLRLLPRAETMLLSQLLSRIPLRTWKPRRLVVHPRSRVRPPLKKSARSLLPASAKMTSALDYMPKRRLRVLLPNSQQAQEAAKSQADPSLPAAKLPALCLLHLGLMHQALRGCPLPPPGLHSLSSAGTKFTSTIGVRESQSCRKNLLTGT
jgi:hypothetical protein